MNMKFRLVLVFCTWIACASIIAGLMMFLDYQNTSFLGSLSGTNHVLLAGSMSALVVNWINSKRRDPDRSIPLAILVVVLSTCLLLEAISWLSAFAFLSGAAIIEATARLVSAYPKDT